MPRQLIALLAALCLPAWAPAALANDSAWGVSFQDISERALSDQFNPAWIALESTRERGHPGRDFQQAWLVAATRPDKGVNFDDVTELWHLKKQSHREFSWHEATRSDWGGKFSKRWGKDIEPARHAADALMERYCLTAIPEPGTAGLLLSGVGLVAFAARRRRRST